MHMIRVNTRTSKIMASLAEGKMTPTFLILLSQARSPRPRRSLLPEPTKARLSFKTMNNMTAACPSEESQAQWTLKELQSTLIQIWTNYSTTITPLNNKPTFTLTTRMILGMVKPPRLPFYLMRTTLSITIKMLTSI
jgi:hypothetical protein